MIRSSFFQRDPVSCARNLIGARIIWGECAGIVVETEAYCAEEDEACHTFVRPSTRDFIGRNKAGAAYVYLNYGVHWMLNALVKGERDGFVLFRALEPVAGIGPMKSRRRTDDLRRLCSGPGKLTQALGITQKHHEMDLCADPVRCFVAKESGVEVVADARIGITRSASIPWRFTLKSSPYVSAPPRPVR